MSMPKWSNVRVVQVWRIDPLSSVMGLNGAATDVRDTSVAHVLLQRVHPLLLLRCHCVHLADALGGATNEQRHATVRKARRV